MYIICTKCGCTYTRVASVNTLEEVRDRIKTLTLTGTSVSTIHVLKDIDFELKCEVKILEEAI